MLYRRLAVGMELKTAVLLERNCVAKNVICQAVKEPASVNVLKCLLRS
jgi:hypothetical protein